MYTHPPKLFPDCVTNLLGTKQSPYLALYFDRSPNQNSHEEVVDSINLVARAVSNLLVIIFGKSKIIQGLNPRWDWGDNGQYAVVVYGNNANYYDFSRDFKSFTQKQLTGSGTPPSMTMTCVDSKKVNR